MADSISLAGRSIDELKGMLDLVKHLMGETRGPGSAALFDQAYAIQQELAHRTTDVRTAKAAFMDEHRAEIAALQAGFNTQLRNFVYDRVDPEAPNAIELAEAVIEAIVFNAFSD